MPYFYCPHRGSEWHKYPHPCRPLISRHCPGIGHVSRVSSPHRGRWYHTSHASSGHSTRASTFRTERFIALPSERHEKRLQVLCRGTITLSTPPRIANIKRRPFDCPYVAPNLRLVAASSTHSTQCIGLSDGSLSASVTGGSGVCAIARASLMSGSSGACH